MLTLSELGINALKSLSYFCFFLSVDPCGYVNICFQLAREVVDTRSTRVSRKLLVCGDFPFVMHGDCFCFSLAFHLMQSAL